MFFSVPLMQKVILTHFIGVMIEFSSKFDFLFKDFQMMVWCLSELVALNSGL